MLCGNWKASVSYRTKALVCGYLKHSLLSLYTKHNLSGRNNKCDEKVEYKIEVVVNKRVN